MRRGVPPQRPSPVIRLPRDGEARAGGWVGPRGAGLPRRRERFRPGQRSGDLARDRAARWGTQGARVGLHSGPVSSAVPETPGGLTHHTLGSPPQRPHKQDWPLTRASARGLPRTASHASPPCTRKTRYTPTVQCHTTGVHTLHTTQLHARASFARAGGSTHTQPPADTHVLPHTSPLPAAARPPPFPAMQTSDFFSSPAEERPLVPGPGGRGSRSRQPNTAALSHPVAPGGAGLWCAEMHEACGFWRSAPFQHLIQYPPPQLLFLPSCLLCPGLSTSLPLLGLPLFPPDPRFPPPR